VVCLGPRDPVDIAGPRDLSGVGARPLNFTVRRPMRALPLLVASAALSAAANPPAPKNDGSLDSVAAVVTAKATAEGCPLSLTAVVGHSARGYYLSFTLKNRSGRPLTFLRQFLPWGNTNSIRVAALTTDGELIAGGYPIDDDFSHIEVTLQPDQTLTGDYDLSQHWTERSIPPSGFPDGKKIVLVWAYRVFAKEVDMDHVPVCTGVTSFTTAGYRAPNNRSRGP